MNQIDISEIDGSLLEDIDCNTKGWALYEAPYDAATVSNQRYQIVFHEVAGRAGIVFCGSGCSGSTHWTDANSPEEVFKRFVADDMRP